MSLKSFYEAALEEVDTKNTQAPEKEVVLELEEDSIEKFELQLRKRSKK